MCSCCLILIYYKVQMRIVGSTVCTYHLDGKMVDISLKSVKYWSKTLQSVLFCICDLEYLWLDTKIITFGSLKQEKWRIYEIKGSDRTPFWKMAAINDTGQIQLGTIAKLKCIGVLYKHGKFHAFTTKCTIFSVSAALNYLVILV